jgi:hypothetical protein
MTALRRSAIAALALIASPAFAADPFDGRWAADLDACSDETAVVAPLMVRPMLLTWSSTACRVQSSYRVGNAWFVGARCWTDGAISDVPIRLQVSGDRLVLNWPKARPEELRRCPLAP